MKAILTQTQRFYLGRLSLILVALALCFGCQNAESQEGKIVIPQSGNADTSLQASVKEARIQNAVATDSQETQSVLTKFIIPTNLRKKSRLEPSGAMWLEDIQRYLLISDDTGTRRHKDHAPWLFLMDRNGVVEETPILVRNAPKVSDLEAMAEREDGRLILISSQSESKKGKRPETRQQIWEVERKGREFTMLRHAAFYSILKRDLKPEEQQALGLSAKTKTGDWLLNIEGMAYRKNSLYFGLKEPVPQTGALIWHLSDLDRFLSEGKLSSGQLSLFATVDLGNVRGRHAGISSMTFDKQGRLWMASTVAALDKEYQQGSVNLIREFTAGRIVATRKAVFPGYKPECLCLVPGGGMTVIFDEGQDTPLFTTIRIDNP